MEENKNINLVIKQELDDSDKELSLSLFTVFRQLKRFVAWWIVVAIIGALLITVISATTSKTTSKATALVSFSFEGIEEGLDPNGATFDVNAIKNPVVIDKALAELGLDSKLSDEIRNSITIKGIIPSDAIDRITVYRNLYSSDSTYSLNAAKEMLDVTYYPTQYKISLNNKLAGISMDTGEQVLDTMLGCYRDYFFELYGYNQALGSAISISGYEEYDFSEAVEVFDTSLRTMEKYVSDLSSKDVTRFRSSQTGYTFADLTEAVKTLITVDLDWISSYITIYNVTKDKSSLITYYQHQIDQFTQRRNVQEQALISIRESIDSYVKDSVVIVGNAGTEAGGPTLTQSSEAYDRLFVQKIEAQTSVADYTERIAYLQKRIEALSNASSSTSAQIKNAQEDLANLSEKATAMLDVINTTANEYYETVTLANAFNILVPASSTSNRMADVLISDVKKPLIITQIFIFAMYLFVALIMAVKVDYLKDHPEANIKPESPNNGSNDNAAPAEPKQLAGVGSKKNSNKK